MYNIFKQRRQSDSRMRLKNEPNSRAFHYFKISKVIEYEYNFDSDNFKIRLLLDNSLINEPGDVCAVNLPESNIGFINELLIDEFSSHSIVLKATMIINEHIFVVDITSGLCKFLQNECSVITVSLENSGLQLFRLLTNA